MESDARLSIATGNTTGVYYSLGGALAEAISEQSAGKLKATAAETSASLQNIQQLVAGTHQVAFSLADTAADAAEGKESFDSPQPIAALARLYPNYTQVRRAQRMPASTRSPTCAARGCPPERPTPAPR